VITRSQVPLLFLAIVALPFAELFLLIRIGRVIGLGSTLAFVVVMGILGAALAKSQGRKVLLQWQEALAAGCVPEEGVLGSVLVLVGGLLLIIPGLISDVLGLLCLLPPTRRALARGLQRYLEQRVQLGQVVQMRGVDFGRRTEPRRPIGGDIIDTEGEEISSKKIDG